jgi:hypothetical protein
MCEILDRFDEKATKLRVYPALPIAECKLIVSDVLTTNTWKDDSWVAN